MKNYGLLTSLWIVGASATVCAFTASPAMLTVKPKSVVEPPEIIYTTVYYSTESIRTEFLIRDQLSIVAHRPNLSESLVWKNIQMMIEQKWIKPSGLAVLPFRITYIHGYLLMAQKAKAEHSPAYSNYIDKAFLELMPFIEAEYITIPIRGGVIETIGTRKVKKGPIPIPVIEQLRRQ